MRALVTSCAAALVVVVTSQAAASSRSPAAVESPARVHIDAIVVDARLPDRALVEDALRVRITDRPVSDSAHARAPEPGELFAYLEVDADTAERASVRLLLSDGRAYVRTIDASEGAQAREIAATIANLLVGIEEGAIAPTEERVALPPALRPVVAAPAPAPAVAPAPAPAPAEGAGEWGVLVGGVNLIALGPPSPTGYAAGGAELRGAYRWRGGATVGLALRLAGAGARPHGLLRVRLAPAAGWSLRRGRFELLALAAVTIEPWLLVRGPPRADRPRSLLLGGALRLEPTGRIPLRRCRSLRLGIFVEAAGSAIPHREGGVARVRARNDDDTLEDLFRAGGFELTAGLLVGAWLPRRV